MRALAAVFAGALAAAVDFQALLDGAIASRAPYVRLPPGNWNLTASAATGVHLSIYNAADLTVDARGCAFVCQNMSRALDIVDARNITWLGGTFDWAPAALPFTQGVVVDVAANASYADILLDPGFTASTAFGRPWFWNASTGWTLDGLSFPWGSTTTWASPGVLRVSNPGIAANVSVGDIATVSTGGNPCHAVSIGISARSGAAAAAVTTGNITFDGLTLLTAPGMGIVEGGGYGNLTLVNVTFAPGPPLTPGGRRRYLSTAWDGVQIHTTAVGPTVRDCTFTALGDDTFSVQSSDFVVVRWEPKPDGSVSAAVISRAGPSDGGLFEGDVLTTSLHGQSATITASAFVGDLAACAADPAMVSLIAHAAPYSLYSLPTTQCFNVTLAAPSPVSPAAPSLHLNASVYCPTRRGEGFSFTGNTVVSSGRVLIKAGRGVVANNTIVTAEKGVAVDPETPVGAAAGMASLVIANNTIVHTGGWHHLMPYGPQAGAIGFVRAGSNYSMAPGTYEDVVVAGNTLVDTRAVNLVLSSVSGATVTGNTFEQTFAVPSGSDGADYGVRDSVLATLSAAENVTFSANHVTAPGSMLGPWGVACLFVDPYSCANITVAAGGLVCNAP